MESKSSVKAWYTIGNKVPRNTDAAATTNKTLLVRRKISRDTKPKPNSLFIRGARNAKSNNAPPTANPRIPKINTPRVGSLAKACTDVNNPDRVIKVPRRLPENAKIAKSTVQLLNTPRFSVTAKEWIKAVPNNQVMSGGSVSYTHLTLPTIPLV